MPDTLYHPIQALLSRIVSLWVRPDVLPVSPGSLINSGKPVLYILEIGGIADRTALQIACKKHKLPPPGNTLNYGTASAKSSVDVLKRRQGVIFRKHRMVRSRRLSNFVQAGVEADFGELQIVPVSIYWGRAPDKESSFWRLLFTENWQFGSRTRKLFTTLIHGRHTLVSFSEPLSFVTLKSSGEPADILQKKLSRILRVHFRQRRIASLGPDQSHRRMLVDHVLSDTSVRAAVQNATDSKVSLEQAQKKAEKYAFEIAADVSYPTVRILHRLLTRLWTELYDGVELSGVERLKAVADGNEIVYIPCHRSHIDYLLLSYILYAQGFSLPHIAAGINLNLPIVGGLLRRGGAFFLRRSFAGNPLYAAVFNAYIAEILQRGHTLEYFVEGGRSRTGRLLPAKGGMLAMTIHAFLRDTQTPVVFVPIYLGYERLLEGRAFTSELAGGKKQKESIFALIKSLRTLREDYGQVYVNIGQPIALNTVLDEKQADWRDLEVTTTRPDWLKPIVNDLGEQLMRSINEAASVTPISLLATTLLATPRGCISRTELEQQINFYQILLKSAYEGTLVVIPNVDASELIDHGSRLGFIETHADAIGPIVQLKPGQAAPLTYFRNNILHLLTLPALVAASLANNRFRTNTEIHRSVTLTFPFLQAELFLATDLDSSAIDKTLEALQKANLLTREGDGWSRASAGSSEDVTLTRLAEVVMPALERHYLCACILVTSSTGFVNQLELTEQCSASAERLSRTHGRPVSDLFDKHLHKTLIKNMNEHGYITSSEDSISATPALLDMEVEARALLGVQVRHAIINTAIATHQRTQTSK
ncbi:MAG: glycerol-3-phosphate O-acyltransferase [bacterium]|jgi:glycerol-3-phosphate O-acyltransferase